MCPKCAEPLLVMELDGIEVDHCLRCQGTWLDSGELELIAERSGGDIEALAEALGAAEVGEKSERRCPRCRHKLRAMRVGPPLSIELDTCARGHGLWFDQGEMIALISGVSEGGGETVGGFFADLYRSELGSLTEGD